MKGDKVIFSILIISLVCPKSQSNSKNWTIFNNSITLLPYTSSLTEEQRDHYFYWVGLRNSFYYSEDSNQLEKLVKYYTPEEKNYYKNLFNFTIPFFICAAVVIIIFIVYMIKRFLLKGCKGPKIIIKSYNHITYFFLITGFLFGLIFLSLTIHNGRKSNENIDKMMDYAKEQKKLLENIYSETYANKKNLDAMFENDDRINTSFYGDSLIQKSHQRLVKKFEDFDKDLYSIQKHKYRFQIFSLILFLLISLLGLAGYFVRREWIPWIASILLLLLAAPVFVMAGLETTYTFLSIDFCSSIGNSIISGLIPSEDKGIGTYFSCPTKDTMRTISTAIYQYIVNFDTLFNETDYLMKNKSFFSELSLGTDKRNNDYFVELLKEVKDTPLPTDIYVKQDDDEKAKNTIMKNLGSFGIFNVILAGLLSMTSCFTAKNTINFIEEQYCYKNHAYMFRNVVFDCLAAVGFVIMSVGLNKLIITMRSHYAKSLRGKKEFNTDILDDDDDD